MLDYERLLDDWADLIYQKVDTINEELNQEVSIERERYLIGTKDAYLRSLAMLSLLENRKRNNYIQDK